MLTGRPGGCTCEEEENGTCNVGGCNAGKIGSPVSLDEVNMAIHLTFYAPYGGLQSIITFGII